MSAYLIFDADIWDIEQYQKYMTAVEPAIGAAGGKYLDGVLEQFVQDTWFGDHDYRVGQAR